MLNLIECACRQHGSHHGWCSPPGAAHQVTHLQSSQQGGAEQPGIHEAVADEAVPVSAQQSEAAGQGISSAAQTAVVELLKLGMSLQQAYHLDPAKQAYEQVSDPDLLHCYCAK